MKVNDRYVSFYYENDHDYGKVEIDPKKTALLVIDMQKVFISRPVVEDPTEEQKKEAARWEQFYAAIDEFVVPNNAKLLACGREIGMDIIFAKIQSVRKDGRDRSLDHRASGYNELMLPPGDENAEIVDELKPLEDEVVIQKTTDSALTGTNLRLMLSNMGIDTVIVTGVLTDQCVSGTVRSLADESFKVWLIEDATRASTAEIQEHELCVLNNIYCHVINTEECIAALKEGAAK